MRVKWEDYFCIDSKSPSWLSWNIDVLCSRGRKTKAKVGVPAGWLDFYGRYTVELGDGNYYCSRIIYEISNGAIPEGMVVDHEDGNAKNNCPSNLKLKTPSQNSMNKKMRSDNSSGKTGVDFHIMLGRLYSRARSLDLEGKEVVRRFSVKKYGVMVAFNMACVARDSMLKELNKQGAMYTERHGKEINE